MTTIHANNAEQALTRLAHCVLTANVGCRIEARVRPSLWRFIWSSHLARLDSKRVVTEVVSAGLRSAE